MSAGQLDMRSISAHPLARGDEDIHHPQIVGMPPPALLKIGRLGSASHLCRPSMQETEETAERLHDDLRRGGIDRGDQYELIDSHEK